MGNIISAWAAFNFNTEYRRTLCQANDQIPL